MQVRRIEVKNFRLLKQVELSLEERTTVIVGRNNSGKTSLAELFRRLLADGSPTFNLEDFSLGVHEQFWAAFQLARQGSNEESIRAALPLIEVRLIIAYSTTAISLGPLGDFVIDLDPGCTDALIEIRYQLEDGKIEAIFDGIELDAAASETEQKTTFFRSIKERLPKLYRAAVQAVDPNDPSNRKSLDWQKTRSLLQSGFINAQRGLDDTTDRDNDVLGEILGVLFKTAMSETADDKDRTTAERLETAVEEIQADIDVNFNQQLEGLLPAFTLFGYPGLPDPKLRTETMLDVGRLLNNHTKVRYSGVNGVHLPEAYNGLGARNLIFILLKLLEFFKSFKARQPAPGIHLVFIEEPEAHLHPQMQEVFISKLSDLAALFAREFNNGQPWPVQFIVTTHSSHIANKTAFKTIRYFLAPLRGATEITTRIKDLSKGLTSSFADDEDFLHQYLTLTRCDLFFADKAILIEGTSERLLLPRMIEKVDASQPPEQRLASQYLSVIEVGGAYAHRFFRLLDFLEIRTLVITDLDASKKSTANKLIACKVSEGSHTTNGCIKDWFENPNVTPAELIKKSPAERTDGIRHLGYQVPEDEGKPCGRSFEEAFILANSTLFELTGESAERDEESAAAKAKDEKKSEFALKYAIEKTEWVVPRYIKDGLVWLAAIGTTPSAAVAATLPAKEVLAPTE